MGLQDVERPGNETRNILLALGWYYPEIHHGVARFARDHHWHVTADFDDLVPEHWRGDGVVTLLGARQNLWRKLRRLKVPIVDLAESRPDIALPRVTMDNAAIGRIAAAHFVERGFRNFAFVHRWDLGVSRVRRDAFKTALAVAGHRCEVLNWNKEAGRSSDTREQRHRWLVRRLSTLPKPLAVFAMRDVEAVEVIEACIAAGIAIPDQVAVLGVDNTDTICDCLRVPLSSVNTNWEQVGYQGAALLERLICGEPAPATPIYIPAVGVCQRRSTDSLAVEHPAVVAALRFIHDHSAEAIDMTDVVRHVAMSRSGLEKAFREYYIRPPMEELRHVRLNRARKELLETDDKIIAIARRTGFQTSQNLCRVFQQQLGITPKQFRLQHR
ncbi:Xylose operon regulatory protein [Rosistilla carotiformis]|uniref:Xylose operon regulatory protein n=1 Tax=Rosistilla carotiformis TaxID=2528017 RepID=A0A518JTA8_9BACT|nr:XylR family transcriptional regulator [Rosistilla carotiformis]QDV68770.1 Xylose operon regulatory protein [Rosistilla carotiformis]